MMTFFKAPKVQMAAALTLIFLTSLLHFREIKLLLLLFLSVVATIGSDFLFLRLRGKPLFFPSAAIVSGIIIALLIPPNSSWYQVFLPGFLAMLSKNFLRVTERHIFNPAAFGLFVAGLLLREGIFWWGVSWQRVTENILAFAVLLSPFWISSFRMRRFLIQLSFLGSLFLMGTLRSVRISLLDPSLLFFTGVMLPEPMTTPARFIVQVAFGISVALLSFFTPLSILSTFPDQLIFSLLIGNILFFKSRS